MAITFVYLLTFLATVSAAQQNGYFEPFELGSCPKYDPQIGFSYKKVKNTSIIGLLSKLENFFYFLVCW